MTWRDRDQIPGRKSAATESTRLNSNYRDVPLCVDCDGTLIRTDLLHESVFLVLKKAPWKVLLLPFWLMRGKAHLKQRLAESADFEWMTLPLNADVLAVVRGAHEAGRMVVLATASHRLLADGLAKHLSLFDEVLATEGSVNLSGERKGARLRSRFGARGFDYVGNSWADLPIWTAARRATLVSSDAELAKAVRNVTEVERVIAAPKPDASAYVRGLRLHQWLKNLLVFVPLLAAHQWSSADGLMSASMAFLSFGLCASAVYVLNDLFDLDSDRRHPRKRNRPFASGLIPVWHGAVLAPVLLLGGFGVAILLPTKFFVVLAGYFLLTLSYSLLLKRQVVVDVLILASLYTIRVISGSAATNIIPSFWLLAFSMFIFLSLAMVKRYSELLVTCSKT